MDCKKFERIMTSYIEDTLSANEKAEAEIHLNNCKQCSTLTNEIKIAYTLINEEKKVTSNPFLSTRVMAAIDNLEEKAENKNWQRVLQPVMITALIVIGIFIGVKMGGLIKNSNQNQMPQEMSYFNDMAMEKLDVIAQNK